MKLMRKAVLIGLFTFLLVNTVAAADSGGRTGSSGDVMPAEVRDYAFNVSGEADRITFDGSLTFSTGGYDVTVDQVRATDSGSDTATFTVYIWSPPEDGVVTQAITTEEVEDSEAVAPGNYDATVKVVMDGETVYTEQHNVDVGGVEIPENPDNESSDVIREYSFDVRTTGDGNVALDGTLTFPTAGYEVTTNPVRTMEQASEGIVFTVYATSPSGSVAQAITRESVTDSTTVEPGTYDAQVRVLLDGELVHTESHRVQVGASIPEPPANQGDANRGTTGQAGEQTDNRNRREESGGVFEFLGGFFGR